MTLPKQSTLTSAQQKALLIVIAIFVGSLALHVLKDWLFPQPKYDFSEFHRQFIARRDSIIAAELAASEAAESAKTNSVAAHSPYNTTSMKQSGKKTHQDLIPININRASASELTALPRIGPAMAERIINYREANGSFVTKKDITKVRGIGEKTYLKMKDMIVLE